MSGEGLSWLILGIAGVWFVFTELPKLIYKLRNINKYDEDNNDPSGNDNIKPRKPYDYM